MCVKGFRFIIRFSASFPPDKVYLPLSLIPYLFGAECPLVLLCFTLSRCSPWQLQHGGEAEPLPPLPDSPFRSCCSSTVTHTPGESSYVLCWKSTNDFWFYPMDSILKFDWFFPHFSPTSGTAELLFPQQALAKLCREGAWREGKREGRIPSFLGICWFVQTNGVWIQKM